MRYSAVLLILALAARAQDGATTDGTTAAAPADPAAADPASDPAATAAPDATATDAGTAADGTDLTPASDTGTPTSVIDLPPTLPSGPWNITYFIAPTRNNYWVNDNDNTAAWAPVNQATNLILSNSNSSVLSQAIVLAQNLQPGTAHYSAHISNLAPGNNYIIWLTLAGDPSQKLAQTQGFHIKANSTAILKQVVGGAVSGTIMNPAGMASGAAATGGGGGVVAGAPGADPNAGGATAAIGGSATPAPAPRGAALRLAPVMGVLAVALFATLL